MFVQVIRGATSDAGALRARFEQWQSTQAAAASGWLGTTAGVADDGQFVAAVEFESEAAARSNSDRPEQGDWWAKTEPLIDDPTFSDTTDVVTWGGGADRDARFVQVMEGRLLDADGARQMLRTVEQDVRHDRPDVTGALIALHGDRFTQVVYFTDEASAREGERRSSDAEPDEQDEEFGKLITDMRYIDLRSPRMHSPA